MGASQGKSKKEQKEEARLWAHNKDVEMATLYGETTKLLNDMRLLQVDFQAMKRTIEEQQHVIENLKMENAAMTQKCQDKQNLWDTEEAHEAEFKRLMDEEWDLIESSYNLIKADLFAGESMSMIEDKYRNCDIKEEKAMRVVGHIFQQCFGRRVPTIDELRKHHESKVLLLRRFFKFEGNLYRSVAKTLFRMNNGASYCPYPYMSNMMH
jgi:hypothetical protein